MKASLSEDFFYVLAVKFNLSKFGMGIKVDERWTFQLGEGEKVYIDNILATGEAGKISYFCRTFCFIKKLEESSTPFIQHIRK